MAASVAIAPPVAPSSTVAGGLRVRILCDELMTMQGVYKNGSGTLPPSLEASATVDALRAICELDRDELMTLSRQEDIRRPERGAEK